MADVALYAIGCKVNQAENDELAMGLEKAGHSITSDVATADLCVVNTCTVTAESDRKSRKIIRMLNRYGASATVVAGCYAEVCPEELRFLPGVVRVIPNTHKDNLLEEILDMLPQPEGNAEKTVPRRARGFVKVQDGCERNCSYCIVPRARGRERSRPTREILEIVSELITAGIREIVLCGVNLGRYNRGPGKDLAYLMRHILAIGDDHRVRLSSIEPEDLKEEWVSEWSADKRVCPHLHLPLQSGDEDILRDMGRGYSPIGFLHEVGSIYNLWPRVALTSEVIVGYPGESPGAFQNTVSLLKQVRPSRVHVFRFSARRGTKAWGREDGVSSAEIERRSQTIRRLAEEWRLGYIEDRKGEMRDMLVESLTVTDDEVSATGTTEDYIKGYSSGLPENVKTGEILRLEICGVKDGRALLNLPARERLG